MRYDATRNELILKIVYYGPGMSGKTTTLRAIHERLPANSRQDLISVDTHSERTIQFDFLPVDLATIQGRQVRLELHTVPGQSYYAATRKQILEHADGVVFVADCRREALDENIASMNEMLANLLQTHPKTAVDRFPVVLQLNKQDLPNQVPLQQLLLLMNVGNWPSFPSVATEGTGVMEPCGALAAHLADALADAQLPAADVPKPAPTSWLITCYRCQKMMEVPSHRLVGTQACSACGVAFVITDMDRGLTAPPVLPIRDATPARNPIAPVLAKVSLRDLAPAVPIRQDTPIEFPEIIDAGDSALDPRRGFGAELLLPTLPYLPGYSVVATLDESPMGRRYRLRDGSGTISRVLILNEGLAADAAFIESVGPWSRLTSQVQHLHLLRLTESRPVGGGGHALFAIDAPEHESLREVLARRRTLAPPHAISIIRQLAQVLGEAAQAGLVHGYLRPEVILLSADGEVLLDELGVPHPARWLVKESQSESAGTEYYLAPEYISEGVRIDVRSDIFLLGCLLYRMLTSEGFVTGYNGHEAIHKLTSAGPRLLRDVQPEISRELSNLHQRMVAIDRRDRIATHAELIRLLDRFGGGAPTPALSLTRTIPRKATDGWKSPETQVRKATATGRLARKGVSTTPAQGTVGPIIVANPVPEGATSTRTTTRFARPVDTTLAPQRPVGRPPVKAPGGILNITIQVAVIIGVTVAIIVLLRLFAR